MRAVVQRVGEASVTVGNVEVGRIDRGLLVYLGVAAEDGPEDADALAGKIRCLRIFPDDTGRMNLDIKQVKGSVLVVSNFTLCADTRRGRRPAFTGAAEPRVAETLVARVCERLRDGGVGVQTGRFGESMLVRSTNDGPINLTLDTRETR
ncbi:MAG: D-aminoacyl-tRNA deacylase [Phycisphaerae bacterium]